MSDCVICGEGPLLLDEFYRCRVCRKQALEQRHASERDHTHDNDASRLTPL